MNNEAYFAKFSETVTGAKYLRLIFLFSLHGEAREKHL